MKSVKLKVILDEDGNIKVEAEGTEGTECLNLMSFLEMVPGLSTTDTILKDDCDTQDVQILGYQKKI